MTVPLLADDSIVLDLETGGLGIQGEPRHECEAEQRAHPRRGSLLAAACGACLLFVLLSTGALLLLVGPIYLGGAAEGNSTSIVSPYA